MSWLSVLLMAAVSYAYIPEYSLIASRAADQHGRNAYLIEQDVSYKKDGETFSVRETWLVQGETSMRVSLEGRGPLKGLVQGTIIFEGGQKSFLEGSGSARNQHLGEDWLEPMFHFRNGRYFRSRLVTLKVAPPESLRDRASLPSEGEIKYEAPNYIRLSRVGGAIAWAIGQPPTSGVHPAAWLEQDQFVLRKYRGSDQIVLRANDYVKFDEGLWFPRQRTYSFGPYIVDVTAVQVKSIGKLSPGDPRFHSASLTPSRDSLKLPDIDALKEFYSRFR
jgi:hypothetical protein